ncbi:hypothetical protein F6B41_26040 [Microbacterium lushaniae]|nr:hypothetical protein F6B41_29580 [Microbacterium lushaniae]KAA9149395.1 hypothetical protein F6B41_26040 [Microbacterium lushaniae]
MSKSPLTKKTLAQRGQCGNYDHYPSATRTGRSSSVTEALGALHQRGATLVRPGPSRQPAPDLLQLTRRLLHHQDIASMVRVFGRETGAFVSVEQPRARPIASYPALRPADSHDHELLAEFPIRLHGLEIGVIRHSAWLSRSIVDLASSVFAHPLLRALDRDREERRQFGMTLQSVLDGESNTRELRALLRARNIDPDERISVVSAETDDGAEAPLGTGCDCPASHPHIPALIDRQHFAIMQGAVEPEEHAQHLLAQVERAAPCRARVGIGEAPGGVVDLRAALLEAREALRRGPGVNRRMPLSMDRLICSLPTGALQEHTRSLLEPVFRHDSERQTELIKTLRVLVAEDFSIVRAARVLFVHQNTVKHRIGQIAELTNLETSRLDVRAQLWIAVTLLDPLPATPAT